jgi:hypothetical protein
MGVNVTGDPLKPAKAASGAPTAGTVLPPLTGQGEKKTGAGRASGKGIR